MTCREKVFPRSLSTNCRFPPPDRPLIRARGEKIRQNGQNPFLAYSVPEAIITLKQGLGRLIRTQSDRGLLAVLDTRMATKGYGKKFLESLPDSPLTHDRSAIEHLFRETDQEPPNHPARAAI